MALKYITTFLLCLGTRMLNTAPECHVTDLFLRPHCCNVLKFFNNEAIKTDENREFLVVKVNST